MPILKIKPRTIPQQAARMNPISSRSNVGRVIPLFLSFLKQTGLLSVWLVRFRQLHLAEAQQSHVAVPGTFPKEKAEIPFAI